ncbi:MAG: hypothetical protein IT281_11315 [Ignavibacteria bacterium]|nr:hypothetical protein [Ignavibacteria bacterium]
MESSLESFDLPEFKRSLEILQPSNREDCCEIHVLVQYRERLLLIRSLKNATESHPASNNTLQFLLKIVRKKNTTQLKPISAEHHFTVRCEGDDWCDREYMFDTIPWLMQQNYETVVDAMAPLFIKQADKPGTD